MKQKVAYQVDLEKNIVKKDVFDREIALCGKLAKKNNGKCNWGQCKSCGVIPLLHKLHKGQLLEKPSEIKAVRSKIFE